MGIQLPESDWKYLRKIVPELLETLSRRVNDDLRALLARESPGNGKTPGGLRPRAQGGPGGGGVL